MGNKKKKKGGNPGGNAGGNAPTPNAASAPTPASSSGTVLGGGTVVGAPSNTGKGKGGQQQQQPKQQQPKQQGPKQGAGKAAPGKGGQPKNEEFELVTPGAKKSEFKFSPPQTEDLKFDFQKPKSEVLTKTGIEKQIKSFIDESKKKELDNLPSSVKKRIRALKKFENDYKDLEKKYREELKELTTKYDALYSTIFNKRQQIVDGVHQPSTEELAPLPEGEAEPQYTEDNVKGIPEFWYKVLKAQSLFDDMITERDEDAVKHLTNITYTHEQGVKFTLDFTFSPNPFFENSVLTKTYHLKFDDDWGDLTLEKAEGTKILWKPGKNLTVIQSKKKQPKRGKKPAKTVTIEEEVDSFFRFFDPPQMPEEDDDIDPELIDSIEIEMQDDYDIGCLIRDRVIPHAVLFFTGEVPLDLMTYGGDSDDDMMYDDEEDDEDDDEDDDGHGHGHGRGHRHRRGRGHDDDDDDDDEDVDSDDEVPTLAPPSGGSTAAPEQPPDCKQQ